MEQEKKQSQVSDGTWQSPAPNGAGKHHPLTALAFMEIGIFEVVFVIVGVLFLLGTINYFNLLPVSEVFPKYLGWLPRQERAKPNNDIYNDFIKSYNTPRPTPTPPVTASFINNTLKPYLKSVVGEKTEVFGISEHLIKNGDTNKNIVINLNTDAGTISGFLTLSNSQSISSVSLSLTETAPFPSPNPPFDLIQKEAAKFFSVEPKGQWGCKIFKETAFDLQFCENFWEEQGGTKRGIYYQNPTSVDARTKEIKVTFAFCEFRQESANYNFKSCIKTFSETGINP